MPNLPQTFSINGLCTELRLAQRTMAERLADVKPDAIDSQGRPRWTLMSALRALQATIPIRGHPLAAKTSGAAPQSSTAAFLAARAVLFAERARLAEIERKEREGVLRPLAELQHVLERIAGLIKNRALALPSKLASRFGSDRKVASMIESLSREEVYDWLQEIADTEIICEPPEQHDKEPVDAEVEDADAELY